MNKKRVVNITLDSDLEYQTPINIYDEPAVAFVQLSPKEADRNLPSAAEFDGDDAFDGHQSPSSQHMGLQE